MHKCSSCGTVLGSLKFVEVIEIENRSATKVHRLCEPCAETAAAQQLGQGSASTLLSAAILENILPGLSEEQVEAADSEGDTPAQTVTVRVSNETACPACKLTAAEFRLRGRLGCPRCYEAFRAALLPLLDRVHDATCHRGRRPAVLGAPPPPPSPPERDLGEIKNRLERAISEERYEDAAKLRDELSRHGQQQEGE